MKNASRIVTNSFIVAGIFLILNTSISAEESAWTVAYENESMRLLTQDLEDTASISEALTQAQETFSHWFEAPHKIDVVISDLQSSLNNLPTDLNERHLTLSRETLASKKGPDRTFSAIIAHETCHLWFIDYVTSKGIPQTTSGQTPAYGHGQINDWLDETVAVACEPTGLAQSRRDTDFPVKDLSHYLKDKHPVYAQIEARVAAILAARQNNGATGQQTIRLTTEDNALIHFYYQSAHFGDFIQLQVQPEELHNVIFYAQPDSDMDAFANWLGFNDVETLNTAFIEYMEGH